MPELKVMTYNVLHFADDKTKAPAAAAYAEVIRSLGADVIGLNETYDETKTSAFGGQAATVARLLGYRYYFAKAAMIRGVRPYGNSILSRRPILDARAVPIPDPSPRRFGGGYESRCVLLCTVDVCGEPVRFAVTHFGLNPDEQENAVRAVLPLIAPTRFVLMGDLNVTPDAPVLRPLLERLSDTAAFPSEQLSFPAQTPDRRIDYILTSADLTAVRAEIPPVVLSDHRPYFAELSF